jgi:hypothetical protein
MLVDRHRRRRRPRGAAAFGEDDAMAKKRPTSTLTAGGAILAALLAAIPMGTAAEIGVLRGDRSDGAGGSGEEMAVEVIRGGGSARAVAAPEAARGAEAGSGWRAAGGGDTLWLVDAGSGSGRILGCRIRETLTVGGRTISCTGGALPPVR